MTPFEKLTFALGHLDRVQSFHSRIDVRVAALFALNVAMAGMTVTNLPTSALGTCVAIPGYLALALMTAACGFLLMVSYSHLSTKSDPSLLYFGDIARLSSEQFIKRISEADTDRLIEDALCQVWRNAEIVKAKFTRTQIAFYLTIAAIAVWIGFLFAVTRATGALPMLGGPASG